MTPLIQQRHRIQSCRPLSVIFLCLFYLGTIKCELAHPKINVRLRFCTVWIRCCRFYRPFYYLADLNWTMATTMLAVGCKSRGVVTYGQESVNMQWRFAGVLDIRRRVGFNLRSIRETKGLSQEGLAFERNLHRTYIRKRCVRNPTVLVLNNIARALNISPAELLKDTGNN